MTERTSPGRMSVFFLINSWGYYAFSPTLFPTTLTKLSVRQAFTTTFDSYSIMPSTPLHALYSTMNGLENRLGGGEVRKKPVISSKFVLFVLN